MCIQASFHPSDKILLETGSTDTKPHKCTENMLSVHKLYHIFSLFLSLSENVYLLPFFILCHPSAQPASSLSLRLLFQLSLPPSYLILSSPLGYSSFSFPQEEPWSYLGYVGFGELKSHFTASLCASPENSAGYLKQFHRSPALSVGMLLIGQLSTPCRLLMLIFYPTLHLLDDPLVSLLSVSLCFFSVPPLTKMHDMHILGFFGDVKEC